MKIKIFVTDEFERKAKRYLKKFSSLKDELVILQENLMVNPEMGVELGAKIRKIRIAVKSKRKGKRGGFRIITYLEVNTIQEKNGKLWLVLIYDKGEVGNISKSDILTIMNRYLED